MAVEDLTWSRWAGPAVPIGPGLFIGFVLSGEGGFGIGVVCVVLSGGVSWMLFRGMAKRHLGFGGCLGTDAVGRGYAEVPD